MLAIGIASSIMANQAAFAFLLAYTCSVLLLLPRGEQWGSSANSPHQIRSSLIKPLQKLLFCCRVWHTNTSTHITTAHRHATHPQEADSFCSYTPAEICQRLQDQCSPPHQWRHFIPSFIFIHLLQKQRRN